MSGEAHVLIPKDAEIPELYSQEFESNPMCRVKLFTPDSNWTWYVIEYDPETKTAFGYVVGFEAELGYFSLRELEELHGPVGLSIERDLYWEPKPLSEVKQDHARTTA